MLCSALTLFSCPISLTLTFNIPNILEPAWSTSNQSNFSLIEDYMNLVPSGYRPAEKNMHVCTYCTIIVGSGFKGDMKMYMYQQGFKLAAAAEP